MTRYEYRLIQAPTEPPRVKGVKGAVPRYLHGLTDAMNDMGRDGWSYVRTDRLPVSSRRGLLRRKDVHEELVMVFRRVIAEAGVPAAPSIRPAAAAPQPEADPRPEHWPDEPAPEPPSGDGPVFDEAPAAPAPDHPSPFDAARTDPAAPQSDRQAPRLFAAPGAFATKRETEGEVPRLSARRDG